MKLNDLDLHPEVRFPAEFVKRLESFLPRIASAREKREGSGRTRLAQGGDEFVGYRPYQPGEDLRQLDWSLLARLDRPFVRTTRREASEHWSILIDNSASMAVGEPSKLQRAAELAAALANLGLRQGARVVVGVKRANEFVADRRSARAGLLAFLEAQRAEGPGSFEAMLAAGELRREAGRVFCLSDFRNVDPAAFLSLSTRGRSACAIQLLAPSELSPGDLGPVEWADPESGERIRIHVDAAVRREYERLLEAWLDSWRLACRRHRAGHGVWDTRSEFEDILIELFAH